MGVWKKLHNVAVQSDTKQFNVSSWLDAVELEDADDHSPFGASGSSFPSITLAPKFTYSLLPTSIMRRYDLNQVTYTKLEQPKQSGFAIAHQQPVHSAPYQVGGSVPQYMRIFSPTSAQDPAQESSSSSEEESEGERSEGRTLIDDPDISEVHDNNPDNMLLKDMNSKEVSLTVYTIPKLETIVTGAGDPTVDKTSAQGTRHLKSQTQDHIPSHEKRVTTAVSLGDVPSPLSQYTPKSLPDDLTACHAQVVDNMPNVGLQLVNDEVAKDGDCVAEHDLHSFDSKSNDGVSPANGAIIEEPPTVVLQTLQNSTHIPVEHTSKPDFNGQAKLQANAPKESERDKITPSKLEKNGTKSLTTKAQPKAVSMDEPAPTGITHVDSEPKISAAQNVSSSTTSPALDGSKFKPKSILVRPMTPTSPTKPRFNSAVDPADYDDANFGNSLVECQVSPSKSPSKSVAFDPSVQDPKGGKLGKKDRRSYKAKEAKKQAEHDSKKAKIGASKEKEREKEREKVKKQREKEKKREVETGEKRKVAKDSKGRIIMVVSKVDEKRLAKKKSTHNIRQKRTSSTDKSQLSNNEHADEQKDDKVQDALRLQESGLDIVEAKIANDNLYDDNTESEASVITEYRDPSHDKQENDDDNESDTDDMEHHNDYDQPSSDQDKDQSESSEDESSEEEDATVTQPEHSEQLLSNHESEFDKVDITPTHQARDLSGQSIDGISSSLTPFHEVVSSDTGVGLLDAEAASITGDNSISWEAQEALNADIPEGGQSRELHQPGAGAEVADALGISLDHSPSQAKSSICTGEHSEHGKDTEPEQSSSPSRDDEAGEFIDPDDISAAIDEESYSISGDATRPKSELVNPQVDYTHQEHETTRVSSTDAIINHGDTPETELTQADKDDVEGVAIDAPKDREAHSSMDIHSASEPVSTSDQLQQQSKAIILETVPRQKKDTASMLNISCPSSQELKEKNDKDVSPTPASPRRHRHHRHYSHHSDRGSDHHEPSKHRRKHSHHDSQSSAIQDILIKSSQGSRETVQPSMEQKFLESDHHHRRRREHRHDIDKNWLDDSDAKARHSHSRNKSQDDIFSPSPIFLKESDRRHTDRDTKEKASPVLKAGIFRAFFKGEPLSPRATHFPDHLDKSSRPDSPTKPKLTLRNLVEKEREHREHHSHQSHRPYNHRTSSEEDGQQALKKKERIERHKVVAARAFKEGFNAGRFSDRSNSDLCLPNVEDIKVRNVGSEGIKSPSRSAHDHPRRDSAVDATTRGEKHLDSPNRDQSYRSRDNHERNSDDEQDQDQVRRSRHRHDDSKERKHGDDEDENERHHSRHHHHTKHRRRHSKDEASREEKSPYSPALGSPGLFSGIKRALNN